MIKSRILVALAAVLAATTMIQTAQAGCGTGRHIRVSRPVVHHHHVQAAPVIHRRVVVERPVVVQHRTVVQRPIVAPQCPQVPAGSKLTLPANFLGPNPGYVFLSVQGTKLPCQIINWANNAVTFQLPPMAVVNPLHASLDIILPHGQLAKKTKILLVSPAQLIVHDNGPQAPLPTLGGPAINAQGPQGPNDVLLPTRPNVPVQNAAPGPVGAPGPGGQAGIPFAPQQAPAPFTVLPPNSPTGASANLLDAISDTEA